MTKEDLISCSSPHEYIFFWGHRSAPNVVTKACFSQWYPCKFGVDGQMYSSTEQYMMAEKARLMGDNEVREQILATDDPREIKKLGRVVKDFDARLWDMKKSQVVVNGNLHKFGQNPELRDFLLSTGDKVLVEASPYDKIWGIGLDANNPDACDPKLWKGENLLGFALMEVRGLLREKETM